MRPSSERQPTLYTHVTQWTTAPDTQTDGENAGVGADAPHGCFPWKHASRSSVLPVVVGARDHLGSPAAADMSVHKHSSSASVTSARVKSDVSGRVQPQCTSISVCMNTCRILTGSCCWQGPHQGCDAVHPEQDRQQSLRLLQPSRCSDCLWVNTLTRGASHGCTTHQGESPGGVQLTLGWIK